MIRILVYFLNKIFNMKNLLEEIKCEEPMLKTQPQQVVNQSKIKINF